jgi:hypothetical protein
MGDKRYWLGTVAFDASYPTGGEVVAAADFDFQVAVEGVLVDAGSALVFTKIVRFDPSTSKFTVGIEDGGTGIEAQAANASDQSGIVDVQVLAFGY